MSVIWRLPNELLSLVFIHYAPDDFDRSNRSFSCLRRAIVLPTHVCRVWREVATATPIYWSFITLKHWDTGALGKVDIDFAKTWLSRAGRSPLSIKLGFSTAPHPIPIVIFPFSAQWEDLNVAISATHSLASVKHKIPNLHRITFTGGGSYNPDAPLATFEIAPRLRKVVLSFYIPPSMFKLPWSQLTEFRLSVTFYPPRECLEILKQSSNLEKCELRMDYGDLNHHATLLIQLPRLTYLNLVTPSMPSGFLDCLVLPTLVELRISITHHQGSWPSTQVVDLLSRSSCSLQKLAVDIVNEDSKLVDVDLVHCLEHTPLLLELDLSVRYSATSLTTKALKRLTPSESNPEHIIPELRTLRIYQGGGFHEALFDMIHARWGLERISSDLTGRVAQPSTVEITGLDEGTSVENFWSHSPDISRLLNLRNEYLVIRAFDKNGNAIVLDQDTQRLMGSD